MKRILTVLMGAAAVAMSVLTLNSCNPTGKESGNAPVVTLEQVSVGMTSATFKVSATGASEIAYVTRDDLTDLPSARGILTAGIKVTSGQEVTLNDLTPGETYYVVAAASSASGEYSEVVTLTLTTLGTDADFEITVSDVTSNTIPYSVTPSDDEIPYIIAILPSSNYADATDDEILAAVRRTLEEAAEAAGTDYAGYLGSAAYTGAREGIFTGRDPQTSYIIAVAGVSLQDGSWTTPLSKIVATTTAVLPELTFNLSVSNITYSSADVIVSPSSSRQNYVWLVMPADRFANVSVSDRTNLTQAEKNAVADEYISWQGALLHAGYGLYQGQQSLSGFSLIYDTDYYLIAFAFTPGVGRDSDCAVESFHTLSTMTAANFNASIAMPGVTPTAALFKVDVDSNCEGIDWYYGLYLQSEYSDAQFAQDVDALFTELTDAYASNNPGAIRLDAMTSFAARGDNTVSVGGGDSPLSEQTAYTFAVIPLDNKGYAVQSGIKTYNFTTPGTQQSEATCKVEFVGLYNGTDVDDLFKTTLTANQEVAVFKFTVSANANVTKYRLWNGDQTDPSAAEYNSDDYFILDEYCVDVEFLDKTKPLYMFTVVNSINGTDVDMTAIFMANDANNVWAPASRVLFTCSASTFSPAAELAALLDTLDGNGQPTN